MGRMEKEGKKIQTRGKSSVGRKRRRGKKEMKGKRYVGERMKARPV